MLSQDVSVMSSAQLGPAKSLSDPSRQPIALLAPPVITWSRVLPRCALPMLCHRGVLTGQPRRRPLSPRHWAIGGRAQRLNRARSLLQLLPQLSQIVGDDGVRLHAAGRPEGQVPDFPFPADVMENVMPAEALAQSRELRQLRLTWDGAQAVTPNALDTPSCSQPIVRSVDIATWQACSAARRCPAR